MMTQFCFHLSLVEPKKAIELSMMAEKYGFDSVIYPDHIISSPSVPCPETWVVLSAISQCTKHIKVGSMVSDVVRHHPSLLAQTAATLDNLSEGRVILGVGAGELMNLLPFGLDIAKPTQLKEAIIVMKNLLNSSPDKMVSFKGEFYQWKDACLQISPVQDQLPIYVGALGKKTREVAGEVADGWLPWIHTEESWKNSISDIETGARRAGRNLDDIILSAFFTTSISDDFEKAYASVKNISVFTLVLERKILKSMGVKEIKKYKEVSIQRGLPLDEVWRSRFEELKPYVPRKAIEEITAIGTADQVIEKIEKYIKMNARFVIVGNPSGQKDLIKDFGSKVIKYFKEQQG